MEPSHPSLLKFATLHGAVTRNCYDVVCFFFFPRLYSELCSPGVSMKTALAMLSPTDPDHALTTIVIIPII